MFAFNIACKHVVKCTYFDTPSEETLGRVHFRCDIFLTANFHPFLLIAVKCLFFNRFFCPLDML